MDLASAPSSTGGPRGQAPRPSEEECLNYSVLHRVSSRCASNADIVRLWVSGVESRSWLTTGHFPSGTWATGSAEWSNRTPSPSLPNFDRTSRTGPRSSAASFLRMTTNGRTRPSSRAGAMTAALSRVGCRTNSSTRTRCCSSTDDVEHGSGCGKEGPRQQATLVAGRVEVAFLVRQFHGGVDHPGELIGVDRGCLAEVNEPCAEQEATIRLCRRPADLEARRGRAQSR